MQAKMSANSGPAWSLHICPEICSCFTYNSEKICSFCQKSFFKRYVQPVLSVKNRGNKFMWWTMIKVGSLYFWFPWTNFITSRQYGGSAFLISSGLVATKRRWNIAYDYWLSLPTMNCHRRRWHAGTILDISLYATSCIFRSWTH